MASELVLSPGARRLAVPAVAVGLFAITLSARAGEAGSSLTLPEALALAETRGFDALAAAAAVRGAEGDAEAARRLRNPQVSGAYLHSTSVPVPGGQTSSSGYAVTASDQGLAEGAATGKRSLRIREAESAVASARSNRDDALREIRRETARAFYAVLLAEAAAGVDRGVAESYARTLELVDERLRWGAASRVDRARVETAKLEADQEVTAAGAEIARARAELGVWLGGRDLEGVVLDGKLEGALPAWTTGTDLAALRAEAL
ncbi:MAG TPA: TolC family protein, partial [Thermoanaerobaculia bacterium]|nr:TolC family protein [Thermoanaerobaculia bacterium]